MTAKIKPRWDQAAGRGSTMVKADKPTPALRPPPHLRSTVDRENFAGRWLKEQHHAAMSQAAPNQSPRRPEHTHVYTQVRRPKGPSLSR